MEKMRMGSYTVKQENFTSLHFTSLFPTALFKARDRAHGATVLQVNEGLMIVRAQNLGRFGFR